MGPKGVAVAIVVIIILAAAFVAVTYQPLNGYLSKFFGIRNDSVYITGVSLEINGPANESCFGNVIQPLQGFYAQRGGSFNYTVNLTDSCTGTHEILNASVLNSGFAVESVNPKLPYEVFRNNTMRLSMEISPQSDFNGGVLTLQVNVT